MTADNSTWDPALGILVCVLSVAAVVGLIWLLVVFHRWILIGLVFWLISSVRRLFR